MSAAALYDKKNDCYCRPNKKPTPACRAGWANHLCDGTKKPNVQLRQSQMFDKVGEARFYLKACEDIEAGKKVEYCYERLGFDCLCDNCQ